MKPLSFKSLKQMLDTLRTEEKCRIYLETRAGMASRFAHIAALCRKDITSSRRAESSKVCISAVTARNVSRYDKE